MSNRSILADEKLQAEFRQTLEDLVKNIPENRTCADCGVKGPRWTSTNLGVFICTRCAGIHRSLGTHISKVKSIDLDNWTPEHVETLKRIGNGLAKQVFEHAIPASYRRPATSGHVGTETLELWIRDKYEHKSFTDKQAYNQVYNLGASSTGRSSAPTHQGTQHHTTSAPPHHSQHTAPHHNQQHQQQHHRNTGPHHAPHQQQQHRPQQQHTQPKSSELLLDFGVPAGPVTQSTGTHTAGTNNRGKDFLDTIEFSQFQTATPARPTTQPQTSAVSHTAPSNTAQQNLQDTKSILMQLYNTTPNSNSFGTQTGTAQPMNTGHVMNGHAMMMPGQSMMLTPGTMMTPQHMMMMQGQQQPQQGMMMGQGQPMMMAQGQVMMQGTQPVMYGNQLYYPAQNTVQYPAQNGQYAQNNTSAMFQQPSQFR